MDVREKLVELLGKAKHEFWYSREKYNGTEFVAGYLIAHGVTAQEWISVKDRLPEKDVTVLGMYQRNPFAAFEPTIVEWIGNGWINTNNNLYGTVTHWMPLSQPPKGETIYCKDCENLMFSDCYGECAKAYKGIVSPNDTCEHAVRKKQKGE